MAVQSASGPLSEGILTFSLQLPEPIVEPGSELTLPLAFAAFSNVLLQCGPFRVWQLAIHQLCELEVPSLPMLEALQERELINCESSFPPKSGVNKSESCEKFLNYRRRFVQILLKNDKGIRERLAHAVQFRLKSFQIMGHVVSPHFIF